MTDYPYIAPCSYFLIYVYEIPGSVDHAGLLKVGDTSFKSHRAMLRSRNAAPTLRHWLRR